MIIMGTRYSNISLWGVSQDELLAYLSHINLDAYISPTINGYTVLYDIASTGYPHNLPKIIQTESNLKSILRKYLNGQQAAMVCLSSHLSRQFSCSVLAVFVIDSLNLWYHLSCNGQMLDEYITWCDKQWQPGQSMGKQTEGETQGGDSIKLCSAFGKEYAVLDIEKILRQPVSLNFDSMKRHESLAKALGISPCWVVGTNYLCCTGEDDFESHYDSHQEDNDPTYEQALIMIKKTLSHKT
ncbi:hypothetical protein [Nostoc sp. FACHB-110]|uniref:hypothetical protein n=1 Tax=Nostoc sp. FACHB-110 TaxID=2692834 RepID=UPI0019B109DB|nr:hypothetical protein [Nostoc sp. FACHB-110]MBD2436261.1 hypothetical protein [Nostoc sp. FACHB-110]